MVDRRRLKQEYKETQRPMGIVRVTNMAELRTWLAATRDLSAYLNRMRFQLQMGAHPSRELQADWARLGPDAFSIEIADELKPSDKPHRDTNAELAELLALWRERLVAEGDRPYESP